MELRVRIDLKVPSQREHRRLHWTLRDTKKFQMIQAVKETMILQDQPGEFGILHLIIGGTIQPENYLITPIVAALRTTGWLKEDCTVSIQADPKRRDLIVMLADQSDGN